MDEAARRPEPIGKIVIFTLLVQTARFNEPSQNIHQLTLLC